MIARFRDDSNGKVRFVIRDLEKTPDFDQNYHFTLFKKLEFSRVLHPDFRDVLKNSSLELLTTYHLKNRKNISTVSKFNETFLGH